LDSILIRSRLLRNTALSRLNRSLIRVAVALLFYRDVVAGRQMGTRYKTLVPAVDVDGNELAGIRLPDIAVPLATYTGWNLRAEPYGASGVLSRLDGMYLAIANTKDQRSKTRAPRASLQERYPSKADYIARIAQAASQLHQERFLLAEDAIEIIQSAAARNLPER